MLARHIATHLHLRPFWATKDYAILIYRLVDLHDYLYCWDCCQHESDQSPGAGNVIRLRSIVRTILEQHAVVVRCRNHTF